MMPRFAPRVVVLVSARNIAYAVLVLLCLLTPKSYRFGNRLNLRATPPPNRKSPHTDPNPRAHPPPIPAPSSGVWATEMRALLAEGAMALAVAPEANASSGGAAASSAGPLWWVSECHGVWYSLAVMLPSLAFVGFLAWQARRSFRRLSYGRSHVVVVAYYALLWAVALLNLLWCFLQVRLLASVGCL